MGTGWETGSQSTTPCEERLAAARTQWAALAKQLVSLYAMEDAQNRQKTAMSRDLAALVQAVSGEQVLGQPVNQFSAAGMARYLIDEEILAQGTTTEPASFIQETQGAGVSVSILLRMKADELKARIAALESRL